MTAEAQEFRQQAGADMAPAVIENVLTGGDNRGRHLLYQLKISMAMAESIDIIVSFLMESRRELRVGVLSFSPCKYRD